MRGQWFGGYRGVQENLPDQVGTLFINVDREDDQLLGVCFLLPTDGIRVPPIAVEFAGTEQNGQVQIREKQIHAVNPQTALPVSWNALREHYPGVNIATGAEIDIQVAGNELKITALSNLGVKFSGEAKRKPFSTESQIKAEVITWDQFKAKVAPKAGRRMLFRGQSQSWKLRSSFHRRKRYVMSKFLQKDMPELQRHLSALTKHAFDFSKDADFGAFVNLAQHHGYPTPLIDWTYSPYVAAFFAFKGIKKGCKEQDKVVRICQFNEDEWKRTLNQPNQLGSCYPFVSVLPLLGIENPRMVPQQAVILASNVDDVEEYIQRYESKHHKIFLTAYDIQWAERDAVMSELSYMGITAGALFPGYDGACEQLREQNFEE